MKETEWKTCPFCGGKAEVHYQQIYMDTGVCIFCTECKARSKFFPCDCTYQYYHGEKNVFISKERATNDAIALWNTRTPQESEVERLTVELESMRTAANSYKMHYMYLAREIFEEIEELAKTYTFPIVKKGVVEIAKEPFWCFGPNDLAELKKKYTEVTDDRE